MLLGIVALVAGAFLPLWRIQLVAPQYQEGLTLEMYSHKIAAGNGGQDLAEINTLNHYIGMKPIAQADFAEMTWMPFAIGIFALLALRAVVIGRIGHLVDLGVLFVYFGAFSHGARFAYRLWSYGHHLIRDAPMRMAPFTPVVIGRQQIANFVQTSLPMAGTACMGLFLFADPRGNLAVASGGAVRPATVGAALAHRAASLAAALIPLGAPAPPPPDRRWPWLRARLASATAGRRRSTFRPAIYTGPFTIARPVTLARPWTRDRSSATARRTSSPSAPPT